MKKIKAHRHTTTSIVRVRPASNAFMAGSRSCADDTFDPSDADFAGETSGTAKLFDPFDGPSKFVTINASVKFTSSFNIEVEPELSF